VQRLFSTFADGWPGLGLLLLRLLASAELIRFGITSIREGVSPEPLILQLVGMGAGVFLFIGLFTPVAGALAALTTMWIAVSHFSSDSRDPWITFVPAILAAAVAMIGPGAWSIDARLFGRKHIDLPGL
jgi:putative oxidoreductase